MLFSYERSRAHTFAFVSSIQILSHSKHLACTMSSKSQNILESAHLHQARTSSIEFEIQRCLIQLPGLHTLCSMRAQRVRAVFPG